MYNKEYVFSSILTEEIKQKLMNLMVQKLSEMLGVEVDNVMAVSCINMYYLR
jgi:hypothetical protein